MKQLIVLAALATILTANAQKKTRLLDSMINSYYKMNMFNGTVLVAEKNNILLNKGYGLKEKRKNTPLQPESIFQIYSITKPITSTVILMLAEKKKLFLDQKLSDYFDLPSADKITIRQLLSHTAGIYEFTRDTIRKEPTEAFFINYLKNKPLDFTPGTAWSYSNSGYWLLGLIIEKVTGMSYEDAVTKMIFRPLGMKSSGFYFDKLASPNKTSGYLNIFDSTKEEAEIYSGRSAYAAGAIYSTTGDLYTFHQALQGNKLLSAKGLKEAYTTVKDFYALGWVVSNYDGKQMTYHSGSAAGYRTNLLRIPGSDICIVMLANTEMVNTQKLTDNLLDILLDKPYFIPRQVKQSKDTLLQYVGEYKGDNGFEIMVTLEEDGLVFEVRERARSVLFFRNRDTYYADDLRTDVIFERDPSGKIKGLEFNMRDVKVNAKRK